MNSYTDSQIKIKVDIFQIRRNQMFISGDAGLQILRKRDR